MPSVSSRQPYAEITLQNGEKFKVVETFSTVMRHQQEALENEVPLMDLMGPDGTRVAADPSEIISVTELRRPTRKYNGNGNGRRKPKTTAAAKAAAKKPTTAKGRLAARRKRGSRKRVTA